MIKTCYSSSQLAARSWQLAASLFSLLSPSRMNIYQPYTIFPLGDSALTIDFGNIISEELNKKVLDFHSQLKNRKFSFIKDIIPAYSSLTVVYDVTMLTADDDSTVFEKIAMMIENLPVED